MLRLLLGQTYYPQILYLHVKDLESAYASLPPEQGGRVAVAKAIVIAAASFVEGCLYDILNRRLMGKIGDEGLTKDLLKRNRSLDTKMKFVFDHVTFLGGQWLVDDRVVTSVRTDLKDLRDKIAHGGRIDSNDLKLDDIAYFRRIACEYLEQVYASFGDPKPAWLGA